MKLAYIVQGSKKKLDKFKLLKKATAKIFLGAYDELVDKNTKNIYGYNISGTTWAEGRNFLLKQALVKAPDTEYFIFLDDDVELATENFQKLEKVLEKDKPYFLIPVMDKALLYNPTNKILTNERCVFIDEQFQVFHRTLVNDKLSIPYVTKFDSINWHVGTSIHECILLLFYTKYCYQMNSLYCANKIHRGINRVDNLSKYCIENSQILPELISVFIESVCSKTSIPWINKIICKYTMLYADRVNNSKKFKTIAKIITLLFKILPIKNVKKQDYCLNQMERKNYSTAIQYGTKKVVQRIINHYPHLVGKINDK